MREPCCKWKSVAAVTKIMMVAVVKWGKSCGKRSGERLVRVPVSLERKAALGEEEKSELGW